METSGRKEWSMVPATFPTIFLPESPIIGPEIPDGFRTLGDTIHLETEPIRYRGDDSITSGIARRINRLESHVYFRSPSVAVPTIRNKADITGTTLSSPDAANAGPKCSRGRGWAIPGYLT